MVGDELDMQKLARQVMFALEPGIFSAHTLFQIPSRHVHSELHFRDRLVCKYTRPCNRRRTLCMEDTALHLVRDFLRRIRNSSRHQSPIPRTWPSQLLFAQFSFLWFAGVDFNSNRSHRNLAQTQAKQFITQLIVVKVDLAVTCSLIAELVTSKATSPVSVFHRVRRISGKQYRDLWLLCMKRLGRWQYAS